MITIVIPSTRPEKLKACLASIEASIDAEPDEVIVIEDKERRGPAWARNQGIEKVESKYTLVLDDDTCLERYALLRFEAYAEYFASQNRVPVAFFGNARPKEPCTEFQSFLHGHGPHFVIPKDSNDAKYIACHPSHMIFPTELLKREKYNESFVFPRCEDRELGWRLQEKYNMKFHHVPTATVIHDHPMTLLRWLVLQKAHAKAAWQMCGLHQDNETLRRDIGITRAEGLEGYARLLLQAALDIVRAHNLSHSETVFGSKFARDCLFSCYRYLCEFVRIFEIRKLLGFSFWGTYGQLCESGDVVEYILKELS